MVLILLGYTKEPTSLTIKKKVAYCIYIYCDFIFPFTFPFTSHAVVWEQSPRGGGSYIGRCGPKGMVFELFWSKIGYGF